MSETTTFKLLTSDWNADPNAPEPEVWTDGDDVFLKFFLNHFVHEQFADGAHCTLRFQRYTRYRIGTTNDEGWYAGQCRFSKIAPRWGEFYEVFGDLRLDKVAGGWRENPARFNPDRHFLFYFKDQTFECTCESVILSLPNGSDQFL